MAHTVLFIGWGMIVVGTIVLRFATIAFLGQMSQGHTVLWSALKLPESATQRGPYRAPGVDWRVQRFIWSNGPADTGDPIVQRSVRIMRIGSILLVAGFVILFAYVRS
jgi:hypothetical protein